TRANDAHLVVGGIILKAYVTTFGYKHMVIQVVSIAADEYNGPPFVLDGNDAVWEGTFLRIWPTRAGIIWPGQRRVGAGRLKDCHKRFRGKGSEDDGDSSTEMG